MKAQSELAGDRKRQAETTRPRIRGVTIWMSSISDSMNLGVSDMFSDTLSGALAGVSLAPAITEELDLLSKFNDPFSEVRKSPC